jgi:hypothetical protein
MENAPHSHRFRKYRYIMRVQLEVINNISQQIGGTTSLF